jgi:hypothetical protein
VRCDLDAAQASALPPPARDSPLFYANAIDQADYPRGYGNNAMYGTVFRRALEQRELGRPGDAG